MAKSIKEKLERIQWILDTLEGAYKDDKGTGEYKDAHEAGILITSVIKSLG